MSIPFIVTIFIIGFVGSFLSGMLGIGGAIINFPMLLYIPTVLGVGHFTSHEVSGIVAIQVFFTTIGGVTAYRKSGYLNKKLIIYMGISVLCGSLIGGFTSQYMSEMIINLIYGVLALLAVLLLFIPRKGIDDGTLVEVDFNHLLATSLSFIVGIAAGIVGAGGSFILVPIMLSILKIPIRMTIASSLAITLISSIGTMFSKLVTGQFSLGPAFILIIASLIASLLGASAGKKVNTKILQLIMGCVITLTAIKIWFEIFSHI